MVNGLVNEKILITGTFRSGTTLMLYLLHKLGWYSGYSEDQLDERFKRNIGAFEIISDQMYYESEKKKINVIKMPTPSSKIGTKAQGRSGEITLSVRTELLQKGYDPDVLIICRRPFHLVQESHRRRRPNKKLIHISTLEYNISVLYEEFSKYKKVELDFPKFVYNFDYLYNNLFSIIDVDKSKLKKLFDKYVNEDLIHVK